MPKAQRTQTCDFIEYFNSIAQTSDSQSHNLANICENDEFWSAELLHMKVVSKPNPNVFFLGQEKKTNGATTIVTLVQWQGRNLQLASKALSSKLVLGLVWKYMQQPTTLTNQYNNFPKAM